MSTIDQVMQWVRPEISKLSPYRSAREEFVGNGDKMILLDANENPFENGMNRYPDPMQTLLKKRLAEAKKVSEKQIYLGNGSDEVLHQLMMIFCVPGRDKVILLPPTFGMYQVCANIQGLEAINVPLDANYQLDTAAILAAQDEHTRMIFIPNPNNPTGNCFKEADILHLIKHFNGIVVLDEAYVEFTAKNSNLHRLDEFSNLIVVQTFSKAQGLAGVRLGMCFAQEQIIALLNKLKAPYNISSLAQTAVLNRLDEQGLVQQQVHQINQEKNKLLLELSTISYIKKIHPSDANFFLIEVDDSAYRYQQLIEKGIVVRNPSKNYNCENTLRITVGKFDENNALISALRIMDNEIKPS